MEYIGDLEDKSANGIWLAYFDGRIGENSQNSRAIRDAKELRESAKGHYELENQFGGVPLWKSPDGDFYYYDEQGKLVPWQAS